MLERDVVRQTLRPGKTYQTLLKGKIETKGTDRRLGLELVVNIFYLFEAAIDRDVIENDGQVIVEHRRFKKVLSAQIDTTLTGLKLNLGEARLPLLAGLTFLFEDAATAGAAVNAIDGLNLKPAADLLKAFGIDVLDLAGQKDAIHKTFRQFDTLQGKAVKQVYWNKEERTGVIEVTSLVGEMTAEEKSLHRNSAVLSDVLLFPRKKTVGDSWTVKGNAFSNLIDPGLRAAVGGEATLKREPDRKHEGKDVYTLVARDGTLTLISDDKSEGEVGWFEPRGEMLFSPADQVVIQGSLSGRGKLQRVSRSHLLFKTEMTQEPTISVTYSCTVIDTPKGTR